MQIKRAAAIPPENRLPKKPPTPQEADKYILSSLRGKIKEDDRMSQIEKLYEAYCMEPSDTPVVPETLRCYEILSEMLPHKEYMEVEALINTIRDNSEKECFFAGFRAATRLWAEATK